MEELIIKALNELLEKVTKSVPQTYKGYNHINISEVKPKDLAKFMQENNIPDEAEFDGESNAYDGWVGGVINLIWEVDIQASEQQKQEYIGRQFKNQNFRAVANVLKPLGYKILNYDSETMKVFGSEKFLYKWLIEKDYQKIVDYFSQRFAKVN